MSTHIDRAINDAREAEESNLAFEASALVKQIIDSQDKIKAEEEMIEGYRTDLKNLRKKDIDKALILGE